MGLIIAAQKKDADLSQQQWEQKHLREEQERKYQEFMRTLGVLVNA
jgi:hypothetical protein